MVFGASSLTWVRATAFIFLRHFGARLLCWLVRHNTGMPQLFKSSTPLLPRLPEKAILWQDLFSKWILPFSKSQHLQLALQICAGSLIIASKESHETGILYRLREPPAFRFRRGIDDGFSWIPLSILLIPVSPEKWLDTGNPEVTITWNLQISACLTMRGRKRPMVINEVSYSAGKARIAALSTCWKTRYSITFDANNK